MTTPLHPTPTITTNDDIATLILTSLPPAQTLALSQSCRFFRQLFLKICFPAESRVERIRSTLLRDGHPDPAKVLQFIHSNDAFTVTQFFLRWPSFFKTERLTSHPVWEDVLFVLRARAILLQTVPDLRLRIISLMNAILDLPEFWTSFEPIIGPALMIPIRIYIDRLPTRDFQEYYKDTVWREMMTSHCPVPNPAYMEWIHAAIRICNLTLFEQVLKSLSNWLLWNCNATHWHTYIHHLQTTPHPPYDKSYKHYLGQYRKTDSTLITLHHTNLRSLLHHLHSASGLWTAHMSQSHPTAAILNACLDYGIGNVAITPVDLIHSILTLPIKTYISSNTPGLIVSPLLHPPAHWTEDDKIQWAHAMYVADRNALVRDLAAYGEWGMNGMWRCSFGNEDLMVLDSYFGVEVRFLRRRRDVEVLMERCGGQERWREGVLRVLVGYLKGWKGVTLWQFIDIFLGELDAENTEEDEADGDTWLEGLRGVEGKVRVRPLDVRKDHWEVYRLEFLRVVLEGDWSGMRREEWEGVLGRVAGVNGADTLVVKCMERSLRAAGDGGGGRNGVDEEEEEGGDGDDFMFDDDDAEDEEWDDGMEEEEDEGGDDSDGESGEEA
ncbi:hypothetical protein HDV00_002105 [Rhizophlyctis rosea]|nr:hypothetical protein HDV00_002105 [Rhizophlyctis rosea]